GPMKPPELSVQLPLVFCGSPNTVHAPGSPLGVGAEAQLSITYVPAFAAEVIASASTLPSSAILASTPRSPSERHLRIVARVALQVAVWCLFIVASVSVRGPFRWGPLWLMTVT